MIKIKRISNLYKISAAWLAGILLLAGSAGCAREETDGPKPVEGEKVAVEFRLDVETIKGFVPRSATKADVADDAGLRITFGEADETATRASAPDETIDHLWVFQYAKSGKYAGQLIGYAEIKGAALTEAGDGLYTFSAELTWSDDCEIIVVANARDFGYDQSLSSLSAARTKLYRYSPPTEETIHGANPMSGSYTGAVPNEYLWVAVERMKAKISLNITDKTANNGITLQSVQLKSVPVTGAYYDRAKHLGETVWKTPSVSSNAADNGRDFINYAEVTSDLDQTINWYLPENRRGFASSAILQQKDKWIGASPTYDIDGEGTSYATHIVIKGVYNDGTNDRNFKITFFPGDQDNLNNNFDIVRNNHYVIDAAISRLDDDDPRIEIEEPKGDPTVTLHLMDYSLETNLPGAEITSKTFTMTAGAPLSIDALAYLYQSGWTGYAAPESFQNDGYTYQRLSGKGEYVTTDGGVTTTALPTTVPTEDCDVYLYYSADVKYYYATKAYYMGNYLDKTGWLDLGGGKNYRYVKVREEEKMPSSAAADPAGVIVDPSTFGYQGLEFLQVEYSYMYGSELEMDAYVVAYKQPHYTITLYFVYDSDGMEYTMTRAIPHGTTIDLNFLTSDSEYYASTQSLFATEKEFEGKTYDFTRYEWGTGSWNPGDQTWSVPPTGTGTTVDINHSLTQGITIVYHYTKRVARVQVQYRVHYYKGGLSGTLIGLPVPHFGYSGTTVEELVASGDVDLNFRKPEGNYGDGVIAPESITVLTEDSESNNIYITYDIVEPSPVPTITSYPRGAVGGAGSLIWGTGVAGAQVIVEWPMSGSWTASEPVTVGDNGTWVLTGADTPAGYSRPGSGRIKVSQIVPGKSQSKKALYSLTSSFSDPNNVGVEYVGTE